MVSRCILPRNTIVARRPEPKRSPRTGQASAAVDQRRIPSQDRSKKRALRILDAAATIFAETGYEAATTEAIAKAAGTSIGSVYQFFPNKHAIFDAIARRHLERARALFDELVGPRALELSWEELLDRAIDAFASMDRVDPDFRAVWTNWDVAGQFLVAGQAMNREFARRIEAVLAAKAKALGKSRRPIVATTIVETITAMLFYAVRKDTVDADAIIEETKVLLSRYLRPYAEGDG
jgi:AcrR family transcriptional regulator